MSEQNLQSKPKKPIYKKWWFWVIVVIVLAAIGKMGEKEKQQTTQTQSQPQEQSESKVQEQQMPTQLVHKIGDKITFDDSEWMVVSAKLLGKEAQSNNQFQKNAVTDGKFVLVSFKVKNLTNKEDRILDAPKLIDSKGREFKDYDGQMFYIPENAKTLVMDALPSNITKQFYALYEVAQDSKELKFQARPLSAFGDKVHVELGF
jgi:hypothetical protein